MLVRLVQLFKFVWPPVARYSPGNSRDEPPVGAMRGRVAQRGAREERARRVRRRHTRLRAATARHHPFRSHRFVYLLYTSATLVSYT